MRRSEIFMPFLSKPSHNNPYVHPPNFDDRLADIKRVIASILHLEINSTLRTRMLVHAIWEITELHGGFQGRYRSRAILTPNIRIQRDHVHQKSHIVRRLVENPDQINAILDDVVHCVVTKEEHEQLTSYSKANRDIDGWDRYKGASIEVLDMLAGDLLHGSKK